MLFHKTNDWQRIKRIFRLKFHFAIRDPFVSMPLKFHTSKKHGYKVLWEKKNLDTRVKSKFRNIFNINSPISILSIIQFIRLSLFWYIMLKTLHQYFMNYKIYNAIYIRNITRFQLIDSNRIRITSHNHISIFIHQISSLSFFFFVFLFPLSFENFIIPPLCRKKRTLVFIEIYRAQPYYRPPSPHLNLMESDVKSQTGWVTEFNKHSGT